MASLLFGYLAGVLSTLSPCVVPLLPVVLAAAASESRFGTLSLAIGLAISFAAVGTIVAVFGFALGLDGNILKAAAGLVMVFVGASLLSHQLQNRVSILLSPIADWFNHRFRTIKGSGLWGQFLVGILLGLVWSPCVGPTLGAASLMASRGENITRVVGTMIAFGAGAATPLVLLGALSRDLVIRFRGKMVATGQRGKFLLGLVMLTIGLMAVFGLDRSAEKFLVNVSPDWLVALSTSL